MEFIHGQFQMTNTNIVRAVNIRLGLIGMLFLMRALRWEVSATPATIILAFPWPGHLFLHRASRAGHIRLGALAPTASKQERLQI